jgi:predicted outer membrane lipoprotein
MTLINIISYNIPITWLLGLLFTAVFGVARIYSMAKDIMNRMSSMENSFKEHVSEQKQQAQRTNELAEDIAYIKGIVKQLNLK